MKEHQVTVFTKPSCQPCNMTKRMLTQRNVAFTEVNIAEDESALNLVKSLGFMEAPVVLVTDSKDSITSILSDQHKVTELLSNPKAVIVDGWSNLRPDKITSFFPQAPSNTPIGVHGGAKSELSLGGLK